VGVDFLRGRGYSTVQRNQLKSFQLPNTSAIISWLTVTPLPCQARGHCSGSSRGSSYLPVSATQIVLSCGCHRPSKFSTDGTARRQRSDASAYPVAHRYSIECSGRRHQCRFANSKVISSDDPCRLQSLRPRKPPTRTHMYSFITVIFPRCDASTVGACQAPSRI
jgi:hypothetical protein